MRAFVCLLECAINTQQFITLTQSSLQTLKVSHSRNLTAFLYFFSQICIQLYTCTQPLNRYNGYNGTFQSSYRHLIPQLLLSEFLITLWFIPFVILTQTTMKLKHLPVIVSNKNFRPPGKKALSTE